jgi:hypothetical protein
MNGIGNISVTQEEMILKNEFTSFVNNVYRDEVPEELIDKD